MPQATQAEMQASFERSRLVDANPLGGAALDGIISKPQQSVVRDTNRPRNPNTAINEAQHELLADVFEIFEQVEAQGGVIPATALQMHPWVVTATGPHNSGIALPKCPIEEEYVTYVQRTWRRDFGDRMGGNFKVTPVWPITIMRDFKKQHEGWGGIVVYMGDRTPGVAKNRITAGFDKIFAAIKKITDREVRETLELAIQEEREQNLQQSRENITDEEITRMIKQEKEIQVLWYEKEYEAAEQVHANKQSNQRSIGFRQRMIARWLLHRKRYATAPGWLTEQKSKDYQPVSCTKCGTQLELDKNNAPLGFACIKCNYIHNGIRAFAAREIKRDHIALQRHTRAELDATGLTDILTLAEEDATEPAEKKPKKAN